MRHNLQTLTTQSRPSSVRTAWLKSTPPCTWVRKKTPVLHRDWFHKSRRERTWSIASCLPPRPLPFLCLPRLRPFTLFVPTSNTQIQRQIRSLVHLQLGHWRGKIRGWRLKTFQEILKVGRLGHRLEQLAEFPWMLSVQTCCTWPSCIIHYTCLPDHCAEESSWRPEPESKNWIHWTQIPKLPKSYQRTDQMCVRCQHPEVCTTCIGTGIGTGSLSHGAATNTRTISHHGFTTTLLHYISLKIWDVK